MARPPRIDYPGAVHHVMNRGAAHQLIFRNDDDRQLFITLWAQAVSRFGIIVYAFCLMDTHYHVLVESPDAQLSRALQFIARSYTQQFNHHHVRDGALFRGRFHSVLVDSAVYLERVARYIELNPVEAGMINLDQLSRYPWSSFGYYTGRESAPSWLNTERVLQAYSSREVYERYVLSGMSDKELDRFYGRELRPNRVLGGEDFVDRVVDQVEGIVFVESGLSPATDELIEAAIVAATHCEYSEFHRSERGRHNRPRSVAVDLGHLLTNATLAELRDRYSFASVQSVHSAIRASRSATNPETKALRQRILDTLGVDGLGGRISNRGSDPGLLT